MVQVGLSNTQYAEPIRYDIGHENRYEGTIAEVSDIKKMEFKYDDEPKERLVITFRTDIDDLEDNVDEETREELREYIASEIQDREDDGLEVDHPEDVVQLVMICTAKVTPAVGNNISESKLYGTLRKLDLAEADDDGDVQLYDRNGNEVNPFEDVEDDQDDNEMNTAFAQYLKDNLTGMRVEYEISNAKRGTDDEYSSVGKVVDLVEDPEAEE